MEVIIERVAHRRGPPGHRISIDGKLIGTPQTEWRGQQARLVQALAIIPGYASYEILDGALGTHLRRSSRQIIASKLSPLRRPLAASGFLLSNSRDFGYRLSSV